MTGALASEAIHETIMKAKDRRIRELTELVEALRKVRGPYIRDLNAVEWLQCGNCESVAPIHHQPGCVIARAARVLARAEEAP